MKRIVTINPFEDRLIGDIENEQDNDEMRAGAVRNNDGMLSFMEESIFFHQRLHPLAIRCFRRSYRAKNALHCRIERQQRAMVPTCIDGVVIRRRSTESLLDEPLYKVCPQKIV